MAGQWTELLLPQSVLLCRARSMYIQAHSALPFHWKRLPRRHQQQPWLQRQEGLRRLRLFAALHVVTSNKKKARIEDRFTLPQSTQVLARCGIFWDVLGAQDIAAAAKARCGRRRDRPLAGNLTATQLD